MQGDAPGRSGCGALARGAALAVWAALSGCFVPPVEVADTRSEIAAAVRAEYRQFVEDARDELGPRAVGADGRVAPPDPAAPRPAPDARPAPVESLAAAPGDFAALWQDRMLEPQFPAREVVRFGVVDMMDRALARSNQLAAVADIPLIRDTAVRAAEGRFDPEAFAEVEVGLDDRVRSSTLETGTSATAPDVLEEERFGGEVGLRQRLLTGGELTVSQSLNRRSSNSEFFIPDPQDDAGWRIELRQPLLDGAGVGVNSAPIQIAKLERDQSVAELRRAVDTQLIEVIRAYWALYEERGRVILRDRLTREMAGLVRTVAGREALDALPSDVAQARAAASRADASIVRARSGVRNAEARLASLLSDPSLFGDRVEIVPSQPPTRAFADVPLETVAGLALENRPEVQAAALQLRAAEIRRVSAENGLMPDLEAFVAVSNGGLSGDSGRDALGEQFDQTDTDLAVGLRLSVPLGNDVDRALFDRRRLEVRQLTSQLRNVADTVLLEAQIGVREVRTAFEEVRAREVELAALDAQVAALAQRDALGFEAGSAFLATYLTAVEQRSTARERLLEAVVAYNLALYTLERVAGTLIESRGVEAARVRSDTLDFIVLTRGEPAAVEPGAGPDIFARPAAVGTGRTDAPQPAP